MATVYKIEVEAVSDWTNYSQGYVQEQISKALKGVLDAENDHVFSSVEVNVKVIG